MFNFYPVLVTGMSNFCIVLCSIWAPFWRIFDIDCMYVDKFLWFRKCIPNPFILQTLGVNCLPNILYIASSTKLLPPKNTTAAMETNFITPNNEPTGAVVNNHSIKNRKDLLLKLMPNFLQKHSDWLIFAKSLLTSANLLMGQADRADLLILVAPNAFEGTTYRKLCILQLRLSKQSTVGRKKFVKKGAFFSQPGGLFGPLHYIR